MNVYSMYMNVYECIYVKVYKLNSWNLLKSCSTFVFDVFTVRINDTVTFVEDGFDEDIEFGDEISDDDEDDVDNVSIQYLQ